MKRNKTEFVVLPAFHGDCILIKTFDLDHNEFIILVDGGTAQTFKYSLKAELKEITHINLLVLTHIDSDHIAGLIALFKNSLVDKIQIDEIWINNPDLVEINNGELISVRQGDNLKNLILEKKPKTKLTQVSILDEVISRSGIEFTILSPTNEIINELYTRWETLRVLETQQNKSNISSVQNSNIQSLEDLNKIPFFPDKSISEDIFNASSIAFLLKCSDVSILLLADSRPEIIAQSLERIGINESNPLSVDYVKVSHHGSLNNTSQELMRLIKSSNYLISTNGGTANHQHPSRETISRIVYNSNRQQGKLNVFFNYNLDNLKERIGDFINENDLIYGEWDAISQNKF
ncbi:ComEC/Rec2 family competence protein [Myroides odoratimimus]|uniref:ComEC/Rec2 family competence protein n=1 Tax=Myroides odoratimimus TaxID=76832 RepID=UPI002180817D|nr:MBL fold metallo-hydrolase [Myroides odoratimimus]MCS7472478.1 MBL fold metallo-hydrolase [Myroides odoratimimus]MDM1086661.1 MBL fold metallo-hydrolase [Myroides odoratimimus]MDM1512981.1 MBL fold metallo-hydrolase [Myroides odoratimimus]